MLLSRCLCYLYNRFQTLQADTNKITTPVSISLEEVSQRKIRFFSRELKMLVLPQIHHKKKFLLPISRCATAPLQEDVSKVSWGLCLFLVMKERYRKRGKGRKWFSFASLSYLFRLKAKAYLLPFIMTKWQRFSLALLWLSMLLQSFKIKILTKCRRLHACEPFHSPRDPAHSQGWSQGHSLQWGLAEAFKMSVFSIKLA